MVRAALYEAANVLLSRVTRFSKLKRWGMDVAKRRGSKRAKGEQLTSTGPLQKGRVLINRDCSAIAGCRKRRVRIPPDVQAIF